ncbi:hypothetical protein F383_30410 [Gossypium arboreum]|uniref:Uncharacterized protein n=1 Tax=Gossypium arboreum TaxID=29729 RepID=A0A0B0N2S4_GOSAR|nr:hypothetical protein F383_30410 [Gossypium arboreum]
MNKHKILSIQNSIGNHFNTFYTYMIPIQHSIQILN